MSKRNIILLGAGGHARSCIDVIEQEGSYIIRGLIGLPREVGTEVSGYPVLGTDEELTALLQVDDAVLITIGHIKSPEARVHLFETLTDKGCTFPIIISPHAYVSSRTTFGAGTIVMHGAVINAGADIGNNCIINSHSLVEHDVIIKDHCHISTSAVLNGGVEVGERTFIGSCSCIRESINIGKGCLIGMGQTVFSDCADNTKIPQLMAMT